MRRGPGIALVAVVLAAGCSRDWDSFRPGASPGDGGPGPGSDAAGLPPDAALVRQTGELRANDHRSSAVPGFACVIENADLDPGHIVVDCADTLIRSVRVRSDSYFAISNQNGERYVVEHVEVDCEDQPGGFDGVVGRNLTVRQTLVHRCASSVRVDGEARVQDSRVYGSVALRVDGNQPVVVERSQLETVGTGNGPVFVDGRAALTLTLTGNRLAGGDYGVFLSPEANYIIRGNRFVRPFTYGPHAIPTATRTSAVWEDNHWADDDTLVPGP